MNRKWLVSCWVALVFMDVVPGRSEVTRESFLSEYKARLKHLRALFGHIQAEGTLTTRFFKPRSDHPFKHRTSTLRFALDGERLALTTITRADATYSDEVGREDVFVRNQENFFALKRDAASPDYSIRLLGEPDKSTISFMKKSINGFAFAPFSMGGLPVQEVVDLPGLEIDEVTERPADGRNALRVKFSYRPRDSGRPPLSGWWLLDRDRGWCLSRYEIVYGNDAYLTSRGHIKYTGDIASPVPTSVEHLRITGKGAREEYHFQFSNIDHEPIPDGAFTLAAFGLGDAQMPPGPPPSRAPFWFLGLMALGILMSLVFRGLSHLIERRRRQDKIDSNGDVAGPDRP